MASANSFSIIFPTHNRAKHIKHALESFLKLKKLNQIKFEIIVVANACSDNTEDIVKRALAKVDIPWKVVEEPIAGLSVARNRGIQEAINDIIVFLDDDIEFHENWLQGIDKSFRESDFDIIGGKIELWWHECNEPKWFTSYERRLLGHNDHGNKMTTAVPNMIFGGNFAFKKSILQLISGFDSSFGRVGDKKGAGEEADFVQRAIMNSLSIGYSPLFTINHLVTSDRIRFSSLMKFSIGAGRAHRSLKRNSVGTWYRKFVRMNIQFIRKVFSNFPHAMIEVVNRLTELKILP